MNNQEKKFVSWLRAMMYSFEDYEILAKYANTLKLRAKETKNEHSHHTTELINLSIELSNQSENTQTEVKEYLFKIEQTREKLKKEIREIYRKGLMNLTIF